jgi:hypothetical protein
MPGNNCIVHTDHWKVRVVHHGFTVKSDYERRDVRKCNERRLRHVVEAEQDHGRGGKKTCVSAATEINLTRRQAGEARF